MRRFAFLLIALAALLGGFALAQDPTAPLSFDFAAWFASSGALATLGIIPIVAWLRKHVLTSLDGVAVVVVDVLLGLVAAAGGHIAGLLAGGWLEALGFGIQSGLVAAGLFQAAKTVTGQTNANPTKPGGGTLPR